MDEKRKVMYKVIQLICVVILGILMVNIFQLVTVIQGTGRVINYAGIMRGGSQRLVKLEISQNPNDDLIAQLDGILTGLKTGESQYDLDKLNDIPYQQKLAVLDQNWVGLQAEIRAYRTDGTNEGALIEASEQFFTLANDVVGTAEHYLEIKTSWLTTLEMVLAVVVGLLTIISLQQALTEIHLVRKNKELAAAAYFDKTTGVPGRLSCDERIWAPMEPREGPYCVMMFDLNNLKWVNDHLGHAEGDRLIQAFADILNRFTSDHIFIGRYGGDEFIMIVKGYVEEKIGLLLDDVARQTELFNHKSDALKIHYAVGYEYGGSSLPQMLERADAKMYADKNRIKAEKSGNRTETSEKPDPAAS